MRDTLDQARVAGFTIVESLLAGVILAVFASALAVTIAQTGRASQRADDHRLAAQWLDTALTRIDMIGPARLVAEGPVDGVFDERFRWSAMFEQDTLYPDLYRVSVTIAYTSGDGRESQVMGYTQLFDPPGLRAGSARWEDL